MYITANITATVKSHGSYEVADLANGLTVSVPSYLVDECDADDDESVDRLLKYCREQIGEQRFNIVVGVMSTAYWYGHLTGVGPDPLIYADAWKADDVVEELVEAREIYGNATTEIVEPFEF